MHRCCVLFQHNPVRFPAAIQPGSHVCLFSLFTFHWQLSLKKREIKLIQRESCFAEAASRPAESETEPQELTQQSWELELLWKFSGFL